MPFVFLRLLIRSRKLKDYRLRWGERLGFYSIRLNDCLWVHAVSVGEVLASIPLIKAMQERNPDKTILVTTMTPTGSARVRAAFGDTVQHVYLPYDLPGALHRFFRAMQPRLCVIMETELWPNLLAACKRRHIPVCLTNARLSEKSARGYARAGALTREMLMNITQISAVGQADAERFIALGADPKNVTVTGNLKFDLEAPAGLQARADALRAELGMNKFIWVAASTHEGEEEMVLAAHQSLLAVNPQALLILVPRHPDRFNQVAELCASQFVMQRRSANEKINADTQVYLGDTMGEMLLMVAAADAAFVGGSLITRGGHNILEPALFAIPLLSGPHVFNFAGICKMFKAADALTTVQDAKSLADALQRFMQDKDYRQAAGQRARAVMDANRGALAKQLQLIQALVFTK